MRSNLPVTRLESESPARATLQPTTELVSHREDAIRQMESRL